MSQSMINDFPDNILSHILSFLPTKDAFRTTVLSRRWPPLCYSLSILQIDVYIHRERDISVPAARKWINFRQFLNAFLLSSRAQNHLTLKYFHLKCHQPVLDSSYFNNWIEAVNHRRVEELDLYLFKIRLEPSVVFCCKTLVILKLSQLYLLTMFRCPVDLPFLKTLHLYRVCFEEMEDFMKLLSACPLLEDLKTHYVQANAGVTAGGYFKPLANLINAEIRLFEVPFRALYNVKDLQIFELGRNLPHHGINSYYKSFPVFQNLTELRLSWLQGIHDWDEVVKMLQSSPILQTLTIVKMHRSPTKEDWTYPHHVPISVSSHLTTCTITDYQAVEADFWFATYILQNAGVLLNMTIRRTSYPEPTESPWYFDGLSSCPRISPACKLSLSKS